MRWPLRNFYIGRHLIDSYKNKISESAVGFRSGSFTLKLARWKKNLASCGPWEASFSSHWLIFGGEEISIPQTWPIRKSCIYVDFKTPKFPFEIN